MSKYNVQCTFTEERCMNAYMKEEKGKKKKQTKNEKQKWIAVQQTAGVGANFTKPMNSFFHFRVRTFYMGNGCRQVFIHLGSLMLSVNIN